VSIFFKITHKTLVFDGIVYLIIRKLKNRDI
jgi:hypothetical protein